MENNNNRDLNPEEILALADKELQNAMERSDIDSAFTTPQGLDNVRLLMTPGDDDPTNLYMRAAIPGNAMALAFVIREKRCRDHGDTEGVLGVKKMVAALVGVDGKRANLVSDTLIGDRRADNARRGLGERIRDAAGMGGNSEEDKRAP